MKTLDQIYEIVEESSHETAFNKEEVRGLYAYLLALPHQAFVVEIGIQFGRSTSVICEFQKDRPLVNVVAVDNWSEGIEAREHFFKQKEKHNWDLTVLSMDSVKAVEHIGERKIDLLHIDGDHSFDGVMTDCKTWIPKVRKGGIVCFDDYGHPTLPSVKKAVQQYIEDTKSLMHLETYGDKLGVFKKI